MRIKQRTAIEMRISRLPLFILCLYAATPIISASENSGYFRDMLPTLFLQLFLVILYKRIGASRNCGMYFLLFISAFLSTVFSVYTEVERTMISYLLLCIITIIFSSIVYTKKDINLFIKFYIIYGVICAVLIILSWAFKIEYQWNRYSIDIIGLHKNPNYINDIILLALVFVINRIVQKDGKFFINAMCMILMIFGCFLTGTRATLLCMVLLIVVTTLYLLFVKKKYGYLALLLLVAIVAYFLFINYMPEHILERLTGEDALNDDVRMFMWTNALKELGKQPFLGMGINGVTCYNSTISKIPNIHNVILQFLCDQGIFGFVILATIITSIWHRIRKQDHFLIVLMFTALYFPILFQNGTVSFVFWWPLAILEIFSSVSARSGICKNEKA